ncbi:MAG: hypothetical protein PHQ00_01485 [Phycisphaerae bacterium]|nr:hypothetical protein [Phycisphaerae bacterium]
MRYKNGERNEARSKDSPATPYGLVVAAAARDKFILQNGDEEYAPLNFEIFRKEPYRSLLLNGDLYEIRIEEHKK